MGAAPPRKSRAVPSSDASTAPSAPAEPRVLAGEVGGPGELGASAHKDRARLRADGACAGPRPLMGGEPPSPEPLVGSPGPALGASSLRARPRPWPPAAPLRSRGRADVTPPGPEPPPSSSKVTRAGAAPFPPRVSASPAPRRRFLPPSARTYFIRPGLAVIYIRVWLPSRRL